MTPTNGWADSAKDWFEVTEVIRTTAIRVVETASHDFKPMLGLKDPLVFAVTLLSRTVESNRSTCLLAKHDFLVEAAMVTRSCIENVIWMRTLASEGVEFVNKMLDDGDRADASIAELIKRLGSSSSGDISDAIEATISRKTKVRIELGKLPSNKDAEMEYALFRMISNNYAHVSRSSLIRHIDLGGTSGPELTMRPALQRSDLLWMMFLAAACVINATHLLIMTFPESERGRFVLSGDERALKLVTDQLCLLRDQNGMGDIPG